MAETAKLPNFLIVGAMKAGTTTVYRDLETQPGIFFPYHKEPHHLCHDEVLTDKGLAGYSWLFRDAKPGQLLGEASTGYTKLPAIQGVPQRALQVLGPDLKLIYSVREPVARAISHHYHLYLDGTAPPDFSETLRQFPELIDFGRYASQIRPWIETFGREQVQIVQLEHYASDRRAGLRDLCSFLEIEPEFDRIDPEAAFNAAEDRRRIPPALTKLWQKVMWSTTYRSRIRPWIPDGLIARMKNAMLQTPTRPSRPPSLEVIDRLIEAFRDDADQLQQMMGREKPLWDFDQVRKKYAVDSQGQTSE